MTIPWRDRALAAADRVEDLLSRMTLEEKTAQLYGVWVKNDTSGGDIAPDEQGMSESFDFDELITRGLGQLTRAFGTAPVDPALGAAALARAQRRIMTANRFGIPAVAHEECLAGFTAWRATAYPVPLAWGATFDPPLVEEMARHIGQDLTSLGVHQGLSPVLDVVRDPRWGRVEETIGEDPYLVGTVGAAYVRGLESTGIVATLKHFAGYAASVGARNHAPVRAGVREFADVTLPPFEMALREGGARSVMAAYTETDGVPVSADPGLLTELLRNDWGFTGTVVSDYFGVGFLETNHRVAGSRAEAAGAALSAGIDVELPTLRCYGEPLVTAVRAGEIPESLVDRAARRVLLQKCELGMLDEDWTPEPTAERIDLDSPANRTLARRLAEESVVLLDNPDDVLPLAPDIRIAVVGPRADDPLAMLGCYSFPSHVLPAHPGTPWASRSPRSSTPCAPNSPTRRSHTRRGATWTARTREGSRRRSRGRPRRTSAWRSWATGRASSAAAPPVRAATRRTSASRGSRRSCWTRWRRRARRWCWSCSPAARTRWAAGRADSRAWSRRSSPGRRAARRWREYCRAASPPRAASR